MFGFNVVPNIPPIPQSKPEDENKIRDFYAVSRHDIITRSRPHHNILFLCVCWVKGVFIAFLFFTSPFFHLHSLLVVVVAIFCCLFSAGFDMQAIIDFLKVPHKALATAEAVWYHKASCNRCFTGKKTITAQTVIWYHAISHLLCRHGLFSF